MNNILQKITEDYAVCQKNSKTLRLNCMQLGRGLSAHDKKLLLSIIDEKDLMIEEAAFDNFEKGFCAGIQFAFEVFSKR